MSADKETLINGISSYKHEQNVLLRIIRKYGKLSEFDFDRIFDGYPKKLRFLLSVDSILLGGEPQSITYWGKWLELMQIMMAIGLIKAKTIDGKVYYLLP